MVIHIQYVISYHQRFYFIVFQALQQNFQSIDHLEVLVNRVKEDLIKMEASVSQAETDLGSSHGFTTVIKPFFFVS